LLKWINAKNHLVDELIFSLLKAEELRAKRPVSPRSATSRGEVITVK
jgi:hypothetical protein